MSNLEKAIKIIGEANLPGRTLHPRQAKAIAEVLEEAGLLAPDVQIIRTVEELEGLDPDTVFMNGWGDLFDVNNVQAGINTEDFPYYFPCSVVATSAQVRAAREAMEEEDE